MCAMLLYGLSDGAHVPIALHSIVEYHMTPQEVGLKALRDVALGDLCNQNLAEQSSDLWRT